VFGVLVRVMLAGFFGMVNCVGGVAVGYMSVVAGLFMVACFVMLSSGMVMFCRVFMVFRGFAVVVDSLLRHGKPLSRVQWTSPGSIAFGCHKPITR
jgi:hypothetical protein